MKHLLTPKKHVSSASGALCCSRCSLTLDERLLYAKAKEERTDEIMGGLMRHRW